ncbi:hypothetical protein BDB00DRAFT_753186, partial [Zychaea mexicana]|uniref:uncharacterized protein n=1 Tax=Zychaea mexicana TaxID=64656 RepID=UPI0022FF1650
FQTNMGGTSNVTQTLMPLLRKRVTRVIVNICSILASIKLNNASNKPPLIYYTTVNTYGFSYRVSKAAKNVLLIKDFASFLGDEDCVVPVIDPGCVQTDMGGGQAPVTPEQAISGVTIVIDKHSKDLDRASLYMCRYIDACICQGRVYLICSAH